MKKPCAKALKHRENGVLRELVVAVIFLNFIYYGTKTLNMRSTLLTNFEVCNTVLWTVGTMVYKSLELIRLA